jgi:hypothetical protein
MIVITTKNLSSKRIDLTRFIILLSVATNVTDVTVVIVMTAVMAMTGV